MVIYAVLAPQCSSSAELCCICIGKAVSVDVFNSVIDVLTAAAFKLCVDTLGILLP